MKTRILMMCFLLNIISFNESFAEKGSTYTNIKEIDTLSMQEVIDLAMKNSDTQLSELSIKKSEYQKRQSIARLLPNVDINASYGHTLKKQKMYFDIGGSSPMGSAFSDGFEVGQTHNLQGGLQVSMPIFSAQLWNALSISETNIALSKEKARESKISLKNEVQKAYISILLAQDAYKVFLFNYEQSEATYKQIKAQYEKGMVAEFDMIRQESRVKSILPNLINAEQSILLAKAKLNVLLDRMADDKINVLGSLEDYEKFVYDYSIDKHQDSISIPETNSSIRQLSLQSKLTEKSVLSKKLAYLPTLSASYNYNYSFAANKFDLSNDRRWSPYSMIGLQLNIPIFSSGNRYYDLKQSKIDLISLNITKAKTERNLSIALMNQYALLEKASKVFVSSKDAVKTADKALSIAKIRYEAGASALLEYNDAELSLLQAKLNYSQAIFDFMTAKYDLEKLLGEEK